MRLKEAIAILESIAPPYLAESWDNVGLMAGDPDQTISTIMLTIDLTAAVLNEAKAKKVNLLVAYHPPIFEPLKRIVPSGGPPGLMHGAIRSNIAVYSVHTALDAAPDGINQTLAEIVGIENPRPIRQHSVRQSDYCKIVVFCPPGDIQRVSEAMFAAGAGKIGQPAQYTKCSFRTAGTGTFQGGPGTCPTIGSPGVFEQVEEVRLETIAPQNVLHEVVAAMIRAHSYEEVAYDVYRLLDASAGSGIGLFGDLEQPIDVTTLVERIKKRLKVKTLGLIGPPKRSVKRPAVAAGSAGSLIEDVIAQSCDFYLTGELKHHNALQAAAAGVTTVCVGHSVSERVILPKLARTLRDRCKDTKIIISTKDRDPFVWC